MKRLVSSALVVCSLMSGLWAGVDRTGPEFQANAHTPDFQDHPSVASDASGNFVVVWESDYQDGSLTGILGRRFDHEGMPRGPEFVVNTYTTGYQDQPSIASDDAGNYVVVWRSSNQDGSTRGIFGQRFDSSGAPRGTEFQVNTYTTDWQGRPSVASDDKGNFVVMWGSEYQDGSGTAVIGRTFDRTGAPRSAEFQINSYTNGDQD